MRTKKIGTWILKQGSINTALVDATANLLLNSINDEVSKVIAPNGLDFAVMAIKINKSIYKLFAFKLNEAEKLLEPYDYAQFLVTSRD